MEFKESESNPTLKKTKTKVIENRQKFAIWHLSFLIS